MNLEVVLRAASGSQDVGHAHELDCLVQNRSFMINCDHVELMVTAGQDVLLKTKSGGILVPKPNTFSDSFESGL